MAAIQVDELVELIKTRRSIRKFTSEPVPDECLEKILDAARWSMSGANGQPWEFIVVRNRETIKSLADTFRRTIGDVTWVMESTRSEEFRQPRFRTTGTPEQQQKNIRQRLAEWSDAPLLIAILGDRRTVQASTIAGRVFETRPFDKGLATAAYIIHLVAAAQGLGAQWVGLWDTAFNEDFKEVLGVPSVFLISMLIPIGYPAIKPIPYRRELKDMVHYERYEMSKFRSNEDVQDFLKYQRQRHMEGGGYKIETS